MNKTRAHKIWDDTMALWGAEHLRKAVVAKFRSPRCLYRNMKRAWTHNRSEYTDTMRMLPTVTPPPPAGNDAFGKKAA